MKMSECLLGYCMEKWNEKEGYKGKEWMQIQEEEREEWRKPCQRITHHGGNVTGFPQDRITFFIHKFNVRIVYTLYHTVA